MGMFTTVIDDQGREIQFKCGYDNCETFRIGDQVPWRIDPDEPLSGYLLDDVYDGAYGPVCDSSYVFIVIKDHRIVAVEPLKPDAEDSQLRYGWSRQRAHVARHYGVQQPPFELWAEKAWADKARRAAQAEARHQQFLAETYGMTTEEAATYATKQFFAAKMREESVLRRILPPVEVAGGHLVWDGPTKTVDTP